MSVARVGRRHLGAVLALAGLLAVVPVGCASAGSGASVPHASAASSSPSSSAPSASSSPTATPTAARAFPHPEWVQVGVATLWRSPSAPRAVDRPALGRRVAISRWLAAMTTADRRGLEGRADSQVLLGQRVVVLSRTSGWDRVVVPGQPTPLDRRGYPGWIPAVQLTPHAPPVATLVATVLRGTVRVMGGSVPVLSFGTTLPVLSRGASVVVALPDGTTAAVPSAAVAVHAPSRPARTPRGADLVRTARAFLGLPYLWAGTSGFGFDCSGLVMSVARVHGIRLPRDADAQARVGRPVPLTALVAGDLLFFAQEGYVHHVAIYAGGGQMIEAPQTGMAVRVVSIGSHPGNVVTARRVASS